MAICKSNEALISKEKRTQTDSPHKPDILSQVFKKKAALRHKSKSQG